MPSDGMDDTFAAHLDVDELGVVVAGLREGVVLYAASRRIVAANAAAQELLGVSFDAMRGAMSGDPLWRCLRADGTPFPAAELPSSVAFATGAPVDAVVVGVQRGDGGVVWLQVSARPILRGGELAGVVATLGDVTAERALADAASAATRELAETEAKLLSVLASIDDYLYAWRYYPDGTVDVAFESLPAAEFLASDDATDPEQGWRAAVHPEDLAAFDAAVLDAQRRGESGEHRYRIVSADGRTRWLHERWRTRRLDDGSTLGEGIVSDVTQSVELESEVVGALTEVKSAYAELEVARATADQLARTDALTGTSNRRDFREHLAPLLHGAAAPGGIILLDVDHFKTVNDTHGHQAGDTVLVDVAQRLRGHLRPDDLLARWGGEEFAIFLRGIRDERTLRERCEQLRRCVEETPVAIAAGALSVTASFGAALAARDEETDHLVDRADRALYHAKRLGRNQTRLAGETSRRLEDADLPESVRTAQALSLAGSVREAMSELHAEQVADLAARTAEALGQSGITILRCRLAGLLHDIGKVALPDSILRKPGPLTDDEHRVMQTHSALGAELARRVSQLAEAAPAIRHHHERFDGTGYPDGLAGEDIPLEARIVAAADAYSAITTDRVYRAGADQDEAIAELEASAGTHLDPAVVTALTKILRDDHAARRARLDEAAA
jgi:diguanylate cyclase (GGDEF)-like protein/putative nucleotidyltransferase with HDIG domain